MAVHATVVNNNDGRIATGKITCASTPDIVDINIGFIPTYVHCWNVSSGGLVEFKWCLGQGSAYAFKTAAAGTTSVITSLGITPSTVNDTFLGFYLGLDTDMNANGEIIYFMAIG